MSCSSCNDCGGYVDNCVENNDCYQNCGCPVEVTSECVTQKTALLNIGTDENEKLSVVLASLDSVLGAFKGGKLAIDADDTCPEFLWDKLEQGANIALEVVGTGCDKKIRISSSTGGVIPDSNVRVSAQDSTSGNLFAKIANGAAISKNVVNPGANEQLKLDVNIDALISKDAGNMLSKGIDGKLKTSYTAPDGTDTKIVEGEGVSISGTGSSDDPYVIATNPAIQAARSCFDGKWKDITLVSVSNPNVTVIAGKPQFRIRFDGTIEFKGSLTFNVAFGTYSSTNRKFTLTVGNIPVTCLTANEQAGVSDLKNINYIDAPQASTDQYTQMYGYIIRKSAQNIVVELQSSFINATSKTVVVDFNGVISHPTI